MKFKAFSLLIAAMLLAGCASKDVKEQDLKSSAAFALGANANNVTISNITKNGDTTRFNATSGKKTYSCYVQSSDAFLWMPALLSDAICSGSGEKSCDALSKKAGRC